MMFTKFLCRVLLIAYATFSYTAFADNKNDKKGWTSKNTMFPGSRGRWGNFSNPVNMEDQQKMIMYSLYDPNKGLFVAIRTYIKSCREQFNILMNKQNDLFDLQNQFNTQSASLNDMRQQSEALQQDIDNMNQVVSNAPDMFKKHNESLAKTNKSISNINKEIEENTQKLSKTNSQKKINNLQDAIADLNKQKNTLLAQINSINAQISAKQQEVEGFKVLLTSKTQELTILNQKINELSLSINDLKQQIDKLNNTNNAQNLDKARTTLIYNIKQIDTLMLLVQRQFNLLSPENKTVTNDDLRRLTSEIEQLKADRAAIFQGQLIENNIDNSNPFTPEDAQQIKQIQDAMIADINQINTKADLAKKQYDLLYNQVQALYNTYGQATAAEKLVIDSKINFIYNTIIPMINDKIKQIQADEDAAAEQARLDKEAADRAAAEQAAALQASLQAAADEARRKEEEAVTAAAKLAEEEAAAQVLIDQKTVEISTAQTDGDQEAADRAAQE